MKNAIEKWAFAFVLLISLLTLFFRHFPFSQASLFNLLLDFGKSILVLTLLWLAPPPQKVIFNIKIFVGLALSFGSIFLFEANLSQYFLLNVFATANGTYFLVLTLVSYLSLGRSLSLVPSLRQIKTKGMYQEIRHPIYACYLGILFSLTIYNPSSINVLALVLFYFGVHLRVAEEEQLLGEVPEYETYRNKVNRAFFSWVIVLPLVLLLAIKLYFNFNGSSGGRESISVSVAYPVMTLKPTDYDEWHSVFVGNHIYYWLFPYDSRNDVPSITSDVSISCISEANGMCKKQKLEFNIENFTDCNGDLYTKDMIRSEWDELNKHHSWILPEHKKCDFSKYDICEETSYSSDLKRRLKNLYYRFGWKYKNKHSKYFGAGRYCFEAKQMGQDGSIMSGVLTANPNFGSTISNINLGHYDTLDSYELDLYGRPNKKNKALELRDSHTPLAYIVVTNPGRHLSCAPWNLQAEAEAIRKHFHNVGLIFPEGDQFKELFSEGEALKESCGVATSGKGTFYLPSYLPNCLDIEKDLNSRWKTTFKKGAWQAKCEDTTNLLLNNVLSSTPNWDGFLTPVSPGYPGRHSIRAQYLSPNSSMSWVGKVSEPEKYFYFLGVGRSMLAVDSKVICGIKPSAMGLGELLLEDLVFCE